MWMLAFIPDSYLLLIVNAILVAGAVSCFLSFFIINRIMRFFPPLASFVGVFQLVSVVLLLAGVYFKGSYQTEQEWRARVAEVEAKVAKAEVEAKQANVQIDKKAEVKIKVIKQRAQIVRQYVDREITKYNNTCVIPNEFVQAHNAAAKNEELK
jgi:hypothetical protein